MNRHPRPPRDALVFDLDGTLVDSVPDLQAALNGMLRELGRPLLSAAAVRGMVGDGVAALVARALAATGGDALQAAPLARFLELYEAAPAARTRPYPGVPKTLQALHRGGCRLAVCTNKPQRLTEAVLEALGLAACFDAVLGGDALPVRKPDPGHVRGALAALGAAPERGVMIGDGENDAAAGRAAGLPVVLMPYGYAHVPLAGLGADALLDRFADLPKVLAGLS
jgi:phosphoglycolate phosphatase